MRGACPVAAFRSAAIRVGAPATAIDLLERDVRPAAGPRPGTRLRDRGPPGNPFRDVLRAMVEV
jgi:hypothetical protein